MGIRCKDGVVLVSIWLKFRKLTVDSAALFMLGPAGCGEDHNIQIVGAGVQQADICGRQARGSGEPQQGLHGNTMTL